MVFMISKDENIDTDELEKQIFYPHNFLFGFESHRKTVWGTEAMRELGCHMIYALKNRDIYAFDDDLLELKRELSVILSNIDILKDKEISDEHFEFRVKNALEVIKVAEKYCNVGVYIG